MAASVKDIIAGRKTFFVAPDKTIFPESFCEEYLSKGYECYFIENEPKISIEKQIEIVISVFADVILFFNLDANIPGINWIDLIRKIHLRHGDNVLMGAMYCKRQNKEERAKLEYMFLFNLGLRCGCIQLEYQRNLNYGIIEKVLFANQAMGRRKSVRAIANKGCTFGFNHEKKNYTGMLQDISVSHFSFVGSEKNLGLKDYEKVEDIQFNIKGLHFRYNAIPFMKRPLNTDEILYVFMFENKTGGTGLDILTQQILVPRLYELLNENCRTLLHRLYETYLINEEKNGRHFLQ
ncbi:MAG: hypothetical protein MJ181_08365 [Treponema sp.]|nr:hypothetical protein [Treponema sp.]